MKRQHYDGSYIVSSLPLSFVHCLPHAGAWQLNSLHTALLVIFRLTARPSVLRRATDIRLSVASRCALHAAPSLVPSDGAHKGPRKLVFPVLCYAAAAGRRAGAE